MYTYPLTYEIVLLHYQQNCCFQVCLKDHKGRGGGRIKMIFSRMIQHNNKVLVTIIVYKNSQRSGVITNLTSTTKNNR